MSCRLPLVALLAAGLAGCAHHSDKAGGTPAHTPRTTVLKLANPDPSQRDLGEFVDAVDRLSGGRLQIHVDSQVHIDDVHYDQRLITDVRGGRYAMAKVGVRAFDLVGVTSFRPLVAPLVVTSYGLEGRVLESPLAERMLGGVRAAGVIGVALLPGDLRRTVGLAGPLVRPADFADLRFGTRPSILGEDTVRLLGAEPVGWVKSGHLQGLDGLDLDPVATASNGYARRIRAVTTNLALWPRAQAILIGRRAYEALTPSQRDVLRRAGAAAVAPSLKRLISQDREALSYLCTQGVQLARATPVDLAAMRRAVAPALAGLQSDAENRRTLAAIRALAGGADLGDARSPRCTAPSSRPSTAGVNRALVGTWRADVTHRRYLAAHPYGDEDPTNWGPQTLELGPGGRFTFRNQRFPGELAGLGTYTTKGQDVALHAGGSFEQGAGETWRLRWSLYRGTLTFRRIGANRTPTVFIAAPWHRVR